MRVLWNGVPMLGRPTGVGRYSRMLLKNLLTRAEVQELAVFDGVSVRAAEEFDEALSSPRQQNGVDRLRRFARSGFPGMRALARRLVKSRFQALVRSRNWDLYHEPNFVPLALTGRQCVTVYDASFWRYPQFAPRDRTKWLLTALPLVLADPHTVVFTISEFSRQELREFCPSLANRPITVASPGVDTTEFSPLIPEEQLARVRAKYGLPGQFALFLGTLEPRKNLRNLLDAFAQLPSSLQEEYPLVVAGMRGWKLDSFHERLRSLEGCGKTRVVGYVEQGDIAPLMRSASVFCFPSWYEGFGLPPLEAAATGTAVLCSDIPALREALGNACIYCEPASVESISQALERLLSDSALREQLCQAGPARANLFTWEQCAERTISGYRAAA